MLDAKAHADATPATGASALTTLSWNGRPIYYRPGTSDCSVIYDVLLRPGDRAEYVVPPSLAPRTILDIGGNIGAAALFFARRFPNAAIHVFEPVPANMALLKKNIAPYPRITPHPVALGNQDGEMAIFASDNDSNLAGFSFFDKGVDTTQRAVVPVRHAQGYLDEHGIDAPDIIKIDTEGAEYTILKALRPEVLARVQWIVGELHGEKDFDLLAYLTPWFEIGTSKAIHNRLFTFNACNKSIAGAIGR